ETLSKYKRLHDALSLLQVQHLRQLSQRLRLFPAGRALEEVDRVGIRLGAPRGEIEPTRTAGETADLEKRWVLRLEQSRILLQQAIDQRAKGPLKEAIQHMDNILTTEPSRLFSLLRALFDELRLVELTKYLARVEAALRDAGADPVAVERFGTAVTSVRGL